uniref:Nitrile-specifier protein n=3 Tax=Pieris rapae TaxID=64459 RepID=B2KXD7_PIERA|nr:nitrile-specifier protein [Pieris rapae]
MKGVVVFLALAALGSAKPRLFETFQDHFKHFMDISNALEGAHWRRQQGQGYTPNPEYIAMLNKLGKLDLEQMFDDLKKEPEVQDIIEYLDTLTIDADYYVENLQWIIQKLYVNDTNGIPGVEFHHRTRRHPMTGTTMTTALADTVSMLPIRQLRATFNEKMAKNALFRNAIEGLKSERFLTLYKALWKNEAFLKVSNILADCDFDLKYVFEELAVSLLGQNHPIQVTFQIQFDEFLDIIVNMESPHWLRQLGGYKSFPEFMKSLDALSKTKLIDHYPRMNSASPAFKKVDAFLKRHGIFVAYWIDRFDFLTEYFQKNDQAIGCNEIVPTEESHRSRRHPMTGRTMHTFLADTVSLLPIRQLQSLFNEKMETNAIFKKAIEGVRNDEFKELYNALWTDDAWLDLVDELKTKYDLDLKYAVETLAPALYGQNVPLYISFQTQFDEFVEIILAKAGDSIKSLIKAYKQNDAFRATLDTLDNTVFIQLYQDLRKLNVFQTLDAYWKKHDVYVPYYIDRFEYLTYRLNTNVSEVGELEIKQSAGQDITPSGTTMADFFADVVKILPKTELAALYEKKMSDNTVFSTAVNSLKSEEGKKLYNDLWENRTFQAVANAYANNDFNFRYIFETFVPALYGQ